MIWIYFSSNVSGDVTLKKGWKYSVHLQMILLGQKMKVIEKSLDKEILTLLYFLEILDVLSLMPMLSPGFLI